LSSSVPSIAIHTYFKNLEVPTVEEGFDSVTKIGFVEKFENEKDETAYKSLVK
jgi:hypothetical protein